MRAFKVAMAALSLLILHQQSALGVIVLVGRAANGTLDNTGTNKNLAPNNLGSYTGQFGGFLGTAIAPQYLLTATHVGSSSTFIYADGGSNDKTYNITLAGNFNDLALWKINGPETFTHWIPIYTGGNEVGQPMVVMGNGTTRGAEVYRPSTTNLAGWQWGGGGTLRSWGTNTVAATPDLGFSGTFAGDFVKFTFNRQLDGMGNVLNPDNSIVSGGDSGGPVFLLDPSDSQWKLAAINSLVEQASQTANGPGFAAALFDARGFFDGPDQITDPNEVPLSSYSTRISSRAAWVNSIAAVPEPGSLMLMGGLLLPIIVVIVRRRRHLAFQE